MSYHIVVFWFFSLLDEKHEIWSSQCLTLFKPSKPDLTCRICVMKKKKHHWFICCCFWRILPWSNQWACMQVLAPLTLVFSSQGALSALAHSKNRDADSCWHLDCLQLLHGYRCCSPTVSGKRQCALVRAILLCTNTTNYFCSTHLFLDVWTGPCSPAVLKQSMVILDNRFLFVS